MTDDQLFRLILLGGFLIFVPFGVWHRLKARTGEKLDRRQEGLFILITLRLMGLMGMAGFITYLVSPASMAWASVPLPRWLRWTVLARPDRRMSARLDIPQLGQESD
jgi:hypothetical protein